MKLWDEEKKKFILHLVTMTDQEILLQKPLKDILNIDFSPFVTWADDLERTDIWSDAWGDVVRTPNILVRFALLNICGGCGAFNKVNDELYFVQRLD